MNKLRSLLDSSSSTTSSVSSPLEASTPMTTSSKMLTTPPVPSHDWQSHVYEPLKSPKKLTRHFITDILKDEVDKQEEKHEDSLSNSMSSVKEEKAVKSENHTPNSPIIEKPSVTNFTKDISTCNPNISGKDCTNNVAKCSGKLLGSKSRSSEKKKIKDYPPETERQTTSPSPSSLRSHSSLPPLRTRTEEEKMEDNNNYNNYDIKKRKRQPMKERSAGKLTSPCVVTSESSSLPYHSPSSSTASISVAPGDGDEVSMLDENDGSIKHPSLLTSSSPSASFSDDKISGIPAGSRDETSQASNVTGSTQTNIEGDLIKKSSLSLPSSVCKDVVKNEDYSDDESQRLILDTSLPTAKKKKTASKSPDKKSVKQGNRGKNNKKLSAVGSNLNDMIFTVVTSSLKKKKMSSVVKKERKESKKTTKMKEREDQGKESLETLVTGVVTTLGKKNNPKPGKNNKKTSSKKTTISSSSSSSKNGFLSSSSSLLPIDLSLSSRKHSPPNHLQQQQALLSIPLILPRNVSSLSQDLSLFSPSSSSSSQEDRKHLCNLISFTVCPYLLFLMTQSRMTARETDEQRDNIMS